MIAPARAAALAVVRAVGEPRGDLGDALSRAKGALGDERDRALASEIALGTLRHRAAIDYQLSRRVSRDLARLDAEVLDILRIAAFQILHLTRVPPAAIVNDAVSQARAAGKASASGLVNAVLRRLTRERASLSWPERPASIETVFERQELTAHLAVVYSHPAWLVERLIDRYGPPAAEAWLAFDNEPPALTLAVNPARATPADAAARLRSEHVETEPARYAPAGLVVRHGRALETRAFREGLFAVQDEASQLVAALVGPLPGERVLDACAAPGGKTITLAASVGGTGLVAACDVRARRVRLLSRTLHQAGAAHARPVHVSAEGLWPFRTGAFDRVLVDAPCSGLGTVRRDPDIRWRREPADLARFAETQLALLRSVAPLVKTGGRLVYSTCSSEPEENEEIAARFLALHPEFAIRRLDELEGLPGAVALMATPEGFLRTLPHRDGLESFFGAVMERGIP